MELICDGCNAHQFLYFNKMVEAKGRPTKSYFEDIQWWSEGGYTCGSKVPGKTFYVQRKLFFGDYIESQYYNHLGGKKANNGIKGRKLLTGNICTIYYLFQDVFSDVEIKKSCYVGVNNPLLVSCDFFNSNIKIPILVRSSSTREKKGQRGAEKTRKLQVSVQRSNKKSRK